MSHIRIAQPADLPQITTIVAEAQAFLKAQGVNQWQNGYPDETTLCHDIENHCLYVAETEGILLGIATLYFFEEPAYQTIYEGHWHNRPPYAVIHRMASGAKARGSGHMQLLLNHLQAECRNNSIYYLRIDTHRKNLPMQRFLTKNGFRYCGVVYLPNTVQNEAERLAYDKIFL